MKHLTHSRIRPLFLGLCAGLGICLAPGGWAQTNELFVIERPTGLNTLWGGSMTVLPDLNGDGVGELAMGTDNHGGGVVTSVHSGADGALLYLLQSGVQNIFMGTNVTAIADHDGDGTSDLLMVGSKSGASGSPDGLLAVYSGATGALLQSWSPPSGLMLQARFEGKVQSLGDVNGDGHPEVMVASRRGGGFAASFWTVFSTADGGVAYEVLPIGTPTPLLIHGAAILSDHNGDGHRDFGVLGQMGNDTHLEIRSAVDGSLIAVQDLPGLNVITGNGEPFVGIADQNGDGLRDLLVGGALDAFAAVYSPADGSMLAEWDCTTQNMPCVGSRIIEAGDFNLNGRSDLLAVELDFGTGAPMRLVGLEVQTESVLFVDANTEFQSAYAHTDRIVALPGVDPAGFASFAVFMESSGEVSVRSFAPEVGTVVCGGASNGQLSAQGSESLSKGQLSLRLDGATPQSPALFLVGDSYYPGFHFRRSLCVNRVRARLSVGFTDGVGCFQQMVDLPSLGTLGQALVFQGVYRGGSLGKLGSSQALRIRLQQ